MNLHQIANGYIATVNPNFTGSWQSSTGYINEGDAAVTGSISTNALDVTFVTTGALVVGSVLAGANILPGTSILAFGTGTGGIGTYTVSVSQTAIAGPITATGDGTRIPQFATTADLTMQVQALSGPDLKQIDSLNIQGVVRAVYMSGFPQGLVRPATKGGDILLIPTGLSGQSNDTWLVVAVLEAWDADGWTKVAVNLQNPPQDQ